MLALAFHPSVEIDLTDAARWYESQQAGLRQRFIIEAHNCFQHLVSDAWLYAVRFDDIRRRNINSFPYGIFYFIEQNFVVVLGVLHAARDAQAQLENRQKAYE